MNLLKKTINERVAEILSLPKDMGGVSTVLKIVDNTFLSVDGYRGIIEYTETTVRLNCTKFIIKINGTDLILKEASSEFICISGNISGVEYIV